MAQTAAERQATYRDKKKSSVDESGHELGQLNIYISKPHRSLLSQLAKKHSMTAGQLLSRMIEESPMAKEFEAEKDAFLNGEASGNSADENEGPR